MSLALLLCARFLTGTVGRFNIVNDKYRKFASKDLSQDNMEEEIDNFLGQKEKERSTISTSVANLLAEIQTANKSKDDLVRDKQAKQREVEGTCFSYSYVYTRLFRLKLTSLRDSLSSN